MDNAALLDVGAEPDSDLVQVAAENGTVPDGGAVVDGDLPGKDDVGGHVRIDGNRGDPLPQGNDPPLPPVVPLHAI